jgi:hypothetical protein
VTDPGTTPGDPRTRRHADVSLVPAQRPEADDYENWRELREPDDAPDYSDDGWQLRRPAYVIVVDHLRPRQPGQPPSLTELLDTMAARIHEPEPDLEAEP